MELEGLGNKHYWLAPSTSGDGCHQNDLNCLNFEKGIIKIKTNLLLKCIAILFGQNFNLTNRTLNGNISDMGGD